MEKTLFGKNLKAARTAREMTQKQLSARIGVEEQTIIKWEGGYVAQPRKKEVLDKVYDVLGVTYDDLFGSSNGFFAKAKGLLGAPDGAVSPVPSVVATLPLVGRGHAGKPGDPELIEGVVELPASVAENHPDAYFLEVEGDCMDKVYPEGCYILVDPRMEPQDGSVGVFSIEGMGYVIRRLKTAAKRLVLVPESFNGSHDDIVVLHDDDRTVEAVGTVVWFQSKKEME